MYVKGQSSWAKNTNMNSKQEIKPFLDKRSHFNIVFQSKS